MSGLLLVGTVGQRQDASPGTSFAVTTTVDIPEGALLTLAIASKGGGTSVDHVSATGLGTLTRRAYQEEPLGGFGDTIAVSHWDGTAAALIPSGTVLTITFDANPQRVEAVLSAWTGDEDGATVAFEDIAETASQSNAPSVEQAVTGADGVAWIGLGVSDHAASAVTVNPDWSDTFTKYAYASDLVLWGQYRNLEQEDVTWATTLSSSYYWAALLAAYRVTPPPPPPLPEGTRQFEADFESETFGVTGASTARRPDAVGFDYRLARAMGPVNLEDVSEGLEARAWRARSFLSEEGDGAVYLQRANNTNTDWEPEVELFTFSAPAMEELGLAFTADGRPVIVGERATGTDGAPEVHLYWYDPRYPAWRFQNLGAGRTPRCVNDYFPSTLSAHVCPPEVDVQVVYLKPGTGLIRLEESSYFATEFATPLAYADTRYLQDFFKTTRHRLVVLYADRTALSGTWEFHRLESVPAADSELLRPEFIAWTSPSLFDAGGSLSRTPDDAVTMTSEILRVRTKNAVDAIEIQATSDWPTGTGVVFGEQNQEVDGGFGALGFHDFSFDITHGQGILHPFGFRARTRKTVAGQTCYSPWSYLLLLPEWPVPTGSDVFVNCDRDLLIDVPAYQVAYGDYQKLVEIEKNTDVSARDDGRPFVCTDGDAITAADTLPGGTYGGWSFVGGERNFGASYPVITHIQNYSYRVRTYRAVDFWDEDGHYAGTVVGPAYFSGGAGAPPPYGTVDYQYPRNFPNDAGLWPDVPVP